MSTTIITRTFVRFFFFVSISTSTFVKLPCLLYNGFCTSVER